MKLSATLPFCFLSVHRALALPNSFSDNARSLFTDSMAFLDRYWDSRYGYLLDVSAAAALRHETRTSSWYAIGLLARNEGDDVANAERIIKAVIGGQHKDPNDQWFGTYEKYPEEPKVGTPTYPAEIYGSYDPNWRGFIGTGLMIGIEEYPHLLSFEVKDLIMESMRNVTIGDSYRVGGVDGDNLYPAYSNPSLMRALTTGWTGRRLNDSNMTVAGENYANEIIELFNQTETLSEFNSPTYLGISLYALTMWDKYLPEYSVMKQQGKRIVEKTYAAVGELWHPGMQNLAGPSDRTYGFDMNKYFAAIAPWLWLIVGKEESSIYEKAGLMSHNADFAQAPLMAILADAHVALVPEDVKEKLQMFQGEHTYHAQAYSPPYDNAVRNITSWVSDNITIGGESFDQNVIGGSSLSPGSWSPAVIQWYGGESSDVGYIVWYSTEAALDVNVSPMSMNLTYPNGNSSSIFTMMMSPPRNRGTVSGWGDADGLNVHVKTFPKMDMNITFAGWRGGAEDPIHDFEYYNFTYSLPGNFSGQPSIQLDLSFPDC